jgi:predicted outer membrane repeat protein
LLLISSPCVLALALALFPPLPADAFDVLVKDGDPQYPCNEIGLSNALNAAVGGTVRFECALPIINVTFQMNTLTGSVSIDGYNRGSQMILDGGGVTRLFAVMTGTTLALMNLTLVAGEAGSADGGAISNAGNLSLVNVTIQNSHANNGGALDNQGTATVRDSLFTQNVVTSSGGAIFNAAMLSVESSQFVQNATSPPNQGIGGAIRSTGEVVITGGTFLTNVASYGGAVSSSNFGTAAILTVTNSIMRGNRATMWDGGALAVSGRLIIAGTVFTGNTASGIGSYGGAISAGGTLVITGSRFYGNHARAGGGLLFSGGIPDGTASNVVFEQNDATYGGALYNVGGAVMKVTNGVFARNTAQQDGGAIRNEGGGAMLTISASTFVSNSALTGGAIENDRVITIVNSTFLTNSAATAGAIRNASNFGLLYIDTSTFANNTATTSHGGAIVNYGTLVIRNTNLLRNVAATGSGGAIAHLSPPVGGLAALTIANSALVSNSADVRGGALYNFSLRDVSVTNSTLSGNSALQGGGIAHYSSTLTILNSTLAYNSAANGGNLALGSGALSAKNSIVAFGAPNNCSAVITNSGNNLQYGGLDSLSCGGTMANADPRLGPLANNGGPTPTHALLNGSAAIDAGTNAGCPATDQRGVVRPQGLACDIGAFESAFRLLFLPLIRR